MAPQNEPRPLGAAGSGNAVCLAANISQNSRVERAPQAQNSLRLQFLAARLRALVEEAIERHAFVLRCGHAAP